VNKVNKIFSKLRDFVGFNDPYDGDYEYEEDGDNYENEYQQESLQTTPEEEIRQRRRSQRLGMSADVGMGGKMSNVIDMPGQINGNYEVVLMEPRSFEEMPQAIQALRERKMVVLNLTMMEPDQAQRAVDFVAGGTYAMDGHQERVGESIFLFTPLCVQVTTQSGLIHEVPQSSPVRPQRINSPTPAWTAETTRIAHSG
jgi:cell division inhibitor SepF